MSAELPTQLKTKRIYKGRIVTLDVDTIQAPDGSELDLEMIRHPGASAVVPLLSNPDAPDPTVLLIHQYRYATDGVIWEIPAGLLDHGEEPAACARRELREEVGAVAAELTYLTTIYTTPGFTDEQIHLFLGTDLEVGETAHEADEFIEVAARPMSRVLAMIRDREIVDAKSIVALLYVAGYTLGQ